MNAVDIQEADEHSVLSFTRKLIEVRNTQSALRLGSIEFLYSDDSLLLLKRTYQHEQILCLFNLGRDEKPVPDLYRNTGRVMLVSGYGAATEGRVPPYSVRITIVEGVK